MKSKTLIIIFFLFLNFKYSYSDNLRSLDHLPLEIDKQSSLLQYNNGNLINEIDINNFSIFYHLFSHNRYSIGVKTFKIFFISNNKFEKI